MSSIINADTSDGLKITSDTSGQIDFQSAGSTKALIDTSGNLKFDSGYGSVATAYGCRAWVNFDGTGTVAIRESGNVSSITDNGTGDYTVNFTTAMVDTNYAASSLCGFSDTGNPYRYATADSWNTSYLRVNVFYSNGGQTKYDAGFVTVSIVR